ncbi:hypothetical protein HMPREF1054_1386 [Haemophilus paraphrohaemolyticus HK411]|uniref:Uncharacterized protein n=1 Tax=Haemophilus paraphrohaemolyticus HK411 TaxID=1095743 RepID=I2NI43_9PAST|nr:hypothetical protein HMPREF1054_1386 [Haemophilus paraphrohaemolyticus HK411]
MAGMPVRSKNTMFSIASSFFFCVVRDMQAVEFTKNIANSTACY